ncbi:MAG: hypothetical protein QOJ70_2234 [Acidobacteriota bacterium]|jgi:hypothetical protein|nr:hypothetical protein [Acidobacteriota bacterium]
MNYEATNLDPIPQGAYPTLTPFTGAAPPLPTAWECVALLHPFSPLQSTSTPEDAANPFFELCVTYINYQAGDFLSAQVFGISGRSWWYIVGEGGTSVSTDSGQTFNSVDVGWSLPDPNSGWFGGQAQNANCAGTSPLNWMNTQEVNWWSIPVGTTTPPAATWMWFDAQSNAPVRMMFGQGPLASPSMGDPTQLALFQMFSFTYFSSFTVLQQTSVPTIMEFPNFPGFSAGPNNFELFTWNLNFGMTVFMTPVNQTFNPLPTRVLYIWKPDDAYQVTADRSQNTLMKSTYNPNAGYTAQEALLTGPAPDLVPPPSQPWPPPGSDNSFLINYNGNEVTRCVSGSAGFLFPEEGPTWVSTPTPDGPIGAIQACIFDNPVLCPGNTVMIVGVQFPPGVPIPPSTTTNYPDSTYLWTWYSPISPDGTSSRPVTFMQSQSQLGEGTSLALADYFYYEEFDSWLDPANFEIPPECSLEPSE